MEGFAVMMGLLPLFLIVVAALACLIPFFIFRIRNEMISMNEKMTTIVGLLSGERMDMNQMKEEGSSTDQKR